MFLRSLILVTSLLLNGTLAFGQNFPYMDWVWAHPNCDNPETVKSWRSSAEGKITRYMISDDTLYAAPIDFIKSQSKYGSGSFGFKSRDENYFEILKFYSNNTMKRQENSLNNKLYTVNGIAINDNKPELVFTACDPKSYAAKFIVFSVEKNLSKNNNPSKANQNAKSNEDFIPQACQKDLNLANQFISNPSMLCTALIPLSMCLQENGGRSNDVAKAMASCDQTQQQEASTQCTRYA